MAENTEHTATEQASTQDLAEVIEELEQYRERLVNDTLATAQRAKLMKKTVMAQMEPELAKIDATLQALRAQQAAQTASN